MDNPANFPIEFDFYSPTGQQSCAQASQLVAAEAQPFQKEIPRAQRGRTLTGTLATIVLTVVATLSAGVPQTVAQDFQVSPVFDMGILTNTLSQSAVIQQEQQRQQQTAATPSRALPSGLIDRVMSAPSPPSSEVSLAYTPTPTLVRETVSGFVMRLRANNPQAAAALEQQLSQFDYSEVYQGLIAETGLRDGDAADALTAYLVLGWMIANGNPTNPTATAQPDQALAVRRQIVGALANNPVLSNPSTRAQLGEELKLLFVVVHAGWQGAQREETLPAYANGIAAIFQQFGGEDLRRIALTDTGFQPQ